MRILKGGSVGHGGFVEDDNIGGLALDNLAAVEQPELPGGEPAEVMNGLLE